MSGKIEDKLYQNRYVVDEGRPHIQIERPDQISDGLKRLLTICPAGCWTVQPDGSMVGALDGCFECGTCRIVGTAHGDKMTWNYPRGGFGISYKFG